MSEIYPGFKGDFWQIPGRHGGLSLGDARLACLMKSEGAENPKKRCRKVEHTTEALLVGGIPTPLKNMSSLMGRMIPYIMENKKCLKPPTRIGNRTLSTLSIGGLL